MNSLAKRQSSISSLSAHNSSTSEERAIPFIKIQHRAKGNQSVQFTVTEEAKTFLKDLEGPLAVITVTGLYRTGKSYLLNRMLLNRKRGFGVGGSVNACTKVRRENKARAFGFGLVLLWATLQMASRSKCSSWILKEWGLWMKTPTTISECSHLRFFSPLHLSTIQSEISMSLLSSLWTC